MSKTTIRRMPVEEMLEVLFPLTSYAFHPSPPFREREDWDETILARKGVTYLALFEGDVARATVASGAMTQQVRGTNYATGGVWGVVTHPAARRKGYCRRLMASLLAADREDGRVLSCLYPFKESFYERLGYVTFPLPRTAKLQPAALAPLLKKDLGGEVELVLIGDGFEFYRDFVRQMQGRVHGFGVFDHQPLPPKRRDSSWLALAKVRNELVGLMLYRLKGQDVTQFSLQASRFYYNSSHKKI